MLENRQVMKRVLPSLFGAYQGPGDRGLSVQSAARDAEARRPARTRSDPTIAMLTPGIYNSAYFEHSFLARQMGVELVEGPDLLVENGFVYMRSDGRPAAGRRDLPPAGRRLPGPALLPPRQRDLGVAGLDERLSLGNVAWPTPSARAWPTTRRSIRSCRT